MQTTYLVEEREMEFKDYEHLEQGPQLKHIIPAVQHHIISFAPYEFLCVNRAFFDMASQYVWFLMRLTPIMKFFSTTHKNRTIRSQKATIIFNPSEIPSSSRMLMIQSPSYEILNLEIPPQINQIIFEINDCRGVERIDCTPIQNQLIHGCIRLPFFDFECSQKRDLLKSFTDRFSYPLNIAIQLSTTQKSRTLLDFIEHPTVLPLKFAEAVLGSALYKQELWMTFYNPHTMSYYRIRKPFSKGNPLVYAKAPDVKALSRGQKFLHTYQYPDCLLDILEAKNLNDLAVLDIKMIFESFVRPKTSLLKTLKGLIYNNKPQKKRDLEDITDYDLLIHKPSS